MPLQNKAKARLEPLFNAMHNFDENTVKMALAQVLNEDATVHMCHPMGDMHGADVYRKCYQPLLRAIPDLERRDWIVLAGETDAGQQWVGCAGHYVGTFVAPWLEIPPTGHFAHIRFHEFYRLENNKIVEIQAIWDIPELMMQANAWPMAPSLGREGLVPGPASQDRLTIHNQNPEQPAQSAGLVVDMLNHLSLHPQKGGPEVMQLSRFWHPRMNWYGPAGIGTCRGIAGFRNWHQMPFLSAMPDRGQQTDGIEMHLFAQGQYVAVTGWPNMKQSLQHDGWMGIAASGQNINLRSLDFWRIDGDVIRENWVLVDLLDLYHQIGVDVFTRLREFNKARNMGNLNYPVGAI